MLPRPQRPAVPPALLPVLPVPLPQLLLGLVDRPPLPVPRPLLAVAAVALTPPAVTPEGVLLLLEEGAEAVVVVADLRPPDPPPPAGPPANYTELLRRASSPMLGERRYGIDHPDVPAIPGERIPDLSSTASTDEYLYCVWERGDVTVLKQSE